MISAGKFAGKHAFPSELWGGSSKCSQKPIPSAAAKGPKATCPNRSDQVCHRVTSEIAGESFRNHKAKIQGKTVLLPNVNVSCRFSLQPIRGSKKQGDVG
jgi:hypothetical protein